MTLLCAYSGGILSQATSASSDASGTAVGVAHHRRACKLPQEAFSAG